MIGNKKIIVAGFLIIGLIILGLIFIQPSAEKLLVQTLESPENISSAHSVINLNINSIPQDTNASFEFWYQKNTVFPISFFRAQILQMTQGELGESAIAFNGETLAVYNSSMNEVVILELADIPVILANIESLDVTGALAEVTSNIPEKMQPLFEQVIGKMAGFDFEDFSEFDPSNLDSQTTQFSKNLENFDAEETVDQILEFATITRTKRVWISGKLAYVIEIKPDPTEIPPDMFEKLGKITVWISTWNKLPLGISYSEGEYTYFSIKSSELEINKEFEPNLFTIDFPNDAEIITLANILPSSMSDNDDAEEPISPPLIPSILPSGANLIETMNIQGNIVSRYEFENGDSFAISIGMSNTNEFSFDLPKIEPSEVELRNTIGQLFQDKDRGRIFLIWEENDFVIAIIGNLTSEQALALAASLE